MCVRLSLSKSLQIPCSVSVCLFLSFKFKCGISAASARKEREPAEMSSVCLVFEHFPQFRHPVVFDVIYVFKAKDTAIHGEDQQLDAEE